MPEGGLEMEFRGWEDGVPWVPYPSRQKPQDPLVAPGIYAPYQPRFEWNLWFAALADWRQYPWVLVVEGRLLEGEPSVLRLFAGDPLGGVPPARGRSVLLEDRFTSLAGKRGDGSGWESWEPGAPA